METEVQVPTVPKFSRYRSVRHALRGKETKAAPPLPQSSPQSEDLPQEKPRHRHVHRPVESSAETNVHHHRHQSRRARAPTVDLTRTPQVHSPRRGTEDLEIGVPASPSRATKPTILSQDAHSNLPYRSRNTATDVNHSQSPSSLYRATDSNIPAHQHARDSVDRERRPRAKQPDEHSRPSAIEKIDLSSQQYSGKPGEDIRVALQAPTKLEGNPEDMISAPIGIEPGGGGIVPGTDAPLSAINAGERTVWVGYEDHVITLPVTPSTTTVDIIRSAAHALADNSLNLKTVEVVEYYKPLGLERPLRPYEHIRDVLNSWEQDYQNSLLLQSLDESDNGNLGLNKVPMQQPGNTSACMYYSNKPGSWDKRFVTLRTDGQIVMAKREGGDAKNVCHMRDFDIYVPTPGQIKKKLKPPKKLCFAIKSQHKSSMFESTENFVHFFAMREKDVAASWFNAVHSWRNWHLGHVMGKVHRKPLTLANPREAMAKARAMEAQHKADRRNAGLPPPPPLSYSNYFARDTYTAAATGGGVIRDPTPMQQAASPSVNQDQELFNATGLLGRAYTQRPRAQQQRERTSAAELRQQRHRPLVDLTPQFHEPPQHVRKGRGVVPEQMPAGGLVDIATSPEVAIPVPPAAAWRRPVISTGGVPGR